MDDIKFRAWNKIEEKYYYKRLDVVMWDLEHGKTVDDIGISIEGYREHFNWIGFDILDKLSWEYEFYPMMHTYDGKEICEGDILEKTFDNDDTVYLGVVKYSAPSFYLDTNSENFADNFQFNEFYKRENIKIIGNVKENEELLWQQ